jgi:hypothetical protein
MRGIGVNPHCNFLRFGRGEGRRGIFARNNHSAPHCTCPAKGGVTMNDLAGVGMLSIWVGIYLLVSSVPDSSWVNAIWYGEKNDVSFAQVHTNDKPSDCDWTHSLLGSKSCHYKTAVRTYGDNGEIVSYDDAWKLKGKTPTTKIKNIVVGGMN